jgi:hypothetical protein
MLIGHIRDIIIIAFVNWTFLLSQHAYIVIISIYLRVSYQIICLMCKYFDPNKEDLGQVNNISIQDTYIIILKLRY